MNHRQLNLHNIIKQQQSKISQLKQQLGLVTQLSQSHMIDSQKKNLDIILQKDQVILYLKQQLDKQRSKKYNQQLIIQQNNLILKQKHQLEQLFNQSKQQTQTISKRNHQLQIKLQKLTEEYQSKLQKNIKQIKKLTQQNQSLNQHFTLTQTQIDKLTKFYKSTMFQLPKRKQTLIWVDNLIKYMEVNQNNSQLKYQQIFNFVKNNLQNLQKQLLKSICQVALMQQNLVKDSDKVFIELRQLCEQMSRKDNEVNISLEQLYKIGRKQNQSSEKIQLQGLRLKIQQLEIQSKQVRQKLRLRIKQLQSQKKTLVLGFQQIKTFLQNKQTNYRQQILSLKHTINELLEANELRQRQFEQQIRILSSQIQSISNRYYENIQYPVMKINEKVQRQLNLVKDELIRLSGENSFRQELLGLGQKLRVYGQSMKQEQKQFVAIQLCMKKGNELLITIRQLLNEMNQKIQRKSQTRLRQNSQQSNIIKQGSLLKDNNIKDNNNKDNNRKQINNGLSGLKSSLTNKQQKQLVNKQQVSKNRKQQSSNSKKQLSLNNNKQQSLVNRQSQIHKDLSFNQSNVIINQVQYYQQQLQQLRQLQSVVSQIQLKEKQSKQIYQMNLLKKHNSKLTDHINMLQKKIRNLSSNKFVDQKSINNYFISQRKIIDLQSQNQQLKQINIQYQHLLNQQINKLITKFDLFKTQYKTSNKQQSAISQAINQLSERHQMIYQILKQRNNQIYQLQSSTIIINNMLIKPSQTFQNLVKQFSSHLSNLTLNQQPISNIINQQYSSINHSNHLYKSRLSINQSTIKQYQQILTKKTDINNNGAKYIIELIKTIRQTFPIRQNKKKDQIYTINNHEKQNIKALSTSKNNKIIGFQKKIKDLIANQQKNKQQITFKLQKIIQMLASFQNKRQKQYKLSQSKQKKMQQLLQKHLKSIVDQIKLSIDKQNRQHIALNTQALKDITSKLRQSIKQNEGMKKQMDVLYTMSRNNERRIQDNFYQHE